MLNAVNLLDAFFVTRCEVEYPYILEKKSLTDGIDAWYSARDVSNRCRNRLIGIVDMFDKVSDATTPIYEFAVNVLNNGNTLWEKKNIAAWREYVDGMLEEDGYPSYPADLDPYIGFGAWVDRQSDTAVASLQKYYDVAYPLYIDACKRLGVEPSNDAFPEGGIIKF